MHKLHNSGLDDTLGEEGREPLEEEVVVPPDDVIG